MRKPNLFTKITPARNLSVSDTSNEDFGDTDWREKAERLQLRRWRKIKHQLV